jgi:hypothetical protein
MCFVFVYCFSPCTWLFIFHFVQFYPQCHRGETQL